MGKGGIRLKRIISAWIEQLIEFESKGEMDRYIQDMNRKGKQYQIVSAEDFVLRIKIQYNNNSMGANEKVCNKAIKENDPFNVPVKVIAKLLHKKKDFIYKGLRQGIFPWGYAVKTSSVWSYYVNSKKFTEFTGIEVKM